MDFGAILDKWENQTPSNKVYEKDTWASKSSREKNGIRRSRLLRKKPDDYIDLHGLNRDDAWRSLEFFFEDCFKKGLEKVQIIHGKGSHYDSLNEAQRNNEAALRELSRHFIENCSFAGESGFCSARDGGTGATWVILKGSLKNLD